ncbi:hypothetical protein ACFRU3_33940, partial [Streptomyces sp. NPDC056910]|uniref:hypothetical protein n=1 Tax=Streptomyces sp. NPDC056910 TaxID=3345964 RepID=UPI0036828A4B
MDSPAQLVGAAVVVSRRGRGDRADRRRHAVAGCRRRIAGPWQSAPVDDQTQYRLTLLSGGRMVMEGTWFDAAV